jgi:hypothetical protein
VNIAYYLAKDSKPLQYKQRFYKTKPRYKMKLRDLIIFPLIVTFFGGIAVLPIEYNFFQPSNSSANSKPVVPAPRTLITEVQNELSKIGTTDVEFPKRERQAALFRKKYTANNCMVVVDSNDGQTEFTIDDYLDALSEYATLKELEIDNISIDDNGSINKLEIREHHPSKYHY